MKEMYSTKVNFFGWHYEQWLRRRERRHFEKQVVKILEDVDALVDSATRPPRFFIDIDYGSSRLKAASLAFLEVSKKMKEILPHCTEEFKSIVEMRLAVAGSRLAGALQ